MIHIKSVLERATPFSAAVTLLLASTVPTLMLMRTASADPLTSRSLMVTSTVANDDVLAPDGSTYTGLAAGDPRNGKEVGHTYTFTAGTTQNLAGFTIEYCETAFGFVGTGACASSLTNGLTGTDDDYDDGFSAASWDGATVQVTSSNSGGSPETDTFTVASNGVANFLTLTNAGTLTVAKDDVITIDFTPTASNHFVNPLANYKNTSNGTYFAHIETFATSGNATAAFGAANPTEVDDGTVTNNITTAIGIYTRVQETLNFSVEGDENQGGPTSDPDIGNGDPCTPLTDPGSLTMGDSNDALSASQAYDARSYFRLATNSANGVSVFYSGDTLKAGTNDIDPLAAATASTVGNEQFGLALDSAATGYNFTGTGTPGTPGLNAVTGYGGGNGTLGTVGSPGTAQFKFDTNSVTQPDEIAQSYGVVSCDTGAVRYAANIASDTPAGIYQTKINYIASPRY